MTDPMNYDPPPFPEFERVEHAQGSPNPEKYWEGMYTDLLKRIDAGEFSRTPAEMEDLTLQICFDKVVKERDALRTQVEGAAKELADARFHLLSNRTLEADRAIGRALSKITSTDGEKT